MYLQGTFEPLRSKHGPMVAGPLQIEANTTSGSYLPHIKGDALEILAIFTTAGTTASSFGLSLRVNEQGQSSCKIGYDLNSKTIAPIGWGADIIDQPPGKVVLHVFLDRSIVET